MTDNATSNMAHGDWPAYAPTPGQESARRELRDQFACAALTGLLSSVGGQIFKPEDTDTLTKVAYGFADAMLARRDTWPGV